ncbi:hypothetical protein HYQ46_004547 [Verticillium longisporum]|nr:hypothetical protein HYQ46_004547 [Verticillium longisporum]
MVDRETEGALLSSLEPSIGLARQSCQMAQGSPRASGFDSRLLSLSGWLIALVTGETTPTRTPSNQPPSRLTDRKPTTESRPPTHPPPPNLTD